ncbi:MAG: selenium-dependent molybdenum cofactor biosynthesis protein YqeB [Chloroflexota bacterium]
MFDVAIRGGGDLGSGVALRLWRTGFRCLILERKRPLAVRRTVAFAEAAWDGTARVEDARAVLAGDLDEAVTIQGQSNIPLMVDPALEVVSRLDLPVLVDATLAKRNLGINLELAHTVLGLGPGFEAGRDVHAVIETNRGPDLGRVIWRGAAEPNTGEPGLVAGKTASRVLRSPGTGRLRATREIGDAVVKDELVAMVGDKPVRAGVTGILRGLARDGLAVEAGMKLGDIDPRGDKTLCYRVSDKSLAIAGGVLEALLIREPQLIHHGG